MLTASFTARDFNDMKNQFNQWLELNKPKGRPLPENAPPGAFWQEELGEGALPVLRNVDGSPIAGVWEGGVFRIHQD